MNHQISSPSVTRLDRQVVLVGKITGKSKLLAACRHNLREIQAELGAFSHIDPTRSANNLVLHGGKTSVEIMDEAGGEFISVSSNLEGNGKIDIDVGDWEALKSAIDSAIKEARP